MTLHSPDPAGPARWGRMEGEREAGDADEVSNERGRSFGVLPLAAPCPRN